MDLQISSLASESEYGPLADDRRVAQRMRSVCKVASVLTRDDQGLVRIRNISDGGMRLTIGIAVVPGDNIEVSLSDSLVFKGSVVWQQSGECGLKFAEAIDSVAALRISSEEARDGKTRAPRLGTDQPIVILSERGLRVTHLHDISQRGLKIADDGTLARGLAVTAMIGPGMERSGYVRWVRNGFVGLILADALSVEELGSVRAL